MNSSSNSKNQYSLGIIGVRGYVGKELLTLLGRHPSINLEWVSSRQLKGQPISSFVQGQPELKELEVESLSPEQANAKNTDIVVLALPNGLAEPFVEAIENNPKTKLIIDLSSDHRFDKNWHYALPELNGISDSYSGLSTPIKISNPGCYATAMQLTLAPIKHLLSARPNCFGVSGYSGAGTSPCANNDLNNLQDNLIGYGLVEHIHETEVSFHLKQPVSFSPHVASFFRGINMTVQVEFKSPQTADGLFQIFSRFYQNFPLVTCQTSIPTIKEVVNQPHCLIGGISVDENGKRATIVSCLDNLLKGAASQALQNINLALDMKATLGISY